MMETHNHLPRRQRLRKTLILISFLLFPVTIYYFSPVRILEGVSKGIVTGSFITFVLLFLSSLVLGRAYCGWVCPGGGLGEACLMAGGKKVPGGKWNLIKYFIWVPWMATIIFLAVGAGGLNSIEPFRGTAHGISIHEPEGYIVYFFFVALIATLAWSPGKRGFCHYVCWMAPFMVIGTGLRNRAGWPALHLSADPSQCRGCRTCAENCPMSLDVPGMVAAESMKSSECILCGTCVDGCEKGAIRFKWKESRRSGRARKPVPK
jgi:ferredoxin-type protein NapH